jgi:ZIP family zinc transporter
VLRLLLAASITGCATAFGAIPFLVFRGIPRRTYDTMLGFGAGLMLGAATLGLLPGALRGVRTSLGIDVGQLLLVLGGFGIGVIVLSFMDRLIPHHHAGGHHEHMHGDEHATGHERCGHETVDERARHQGILVLGAMTLHRLPEGFAIGAGFAVDSLHPLGVMLAVAIAVQNAVEGAVMAAPLRRGGLGRARLLLLVTLTGMAVPISALFGYYFSARGSVLPMALAIGAGALIYLACNEVVPESHSHGNERQATFGLVCGFVLIILLQALTGHTD